MPDVSTDTAMHAQAQIAVILGESLVLAENREEVTKIMQRLLDAAVAYMVLSTGRTHDDP